MSRLPELCQSDLLGVVYWVDEKMKERVPANYLFVSPAAFSKEFWTIAEEMAQLNDYCVLLMEETANKLRDLKNDHKALSSDSDSDTARFDPKILEYRGEFIDSLEEGIETWEDTYHFISRATCLLLLSAFTEKSLKALCSGLAPGGSRAPRTNRGESKVTSMIRFLRETANLDFVEPEESTILRGKCRRLRNDFAHGDWDQVRAQVRSIHLGKSFSAVSELLRLIEQATHGSGGERTENGNS